MEKAFKGNWNYDMQQGFSKADSLLKKTNPEEQEDLFILRREIITFFHFFLKWKLKKNIFRSVVFPPNYLAVAVLLNKLPIWLAVLLFLLSSSYSIRSWEFASCQFVP